MSNTADYISIEDAEKLTGLSKNTLVRFANAGYFPTKPVNDGDYLIATKELCEMLKIDRPLNSSDLATETKYDNSSYDSAGRSSADYEGVVIDFPKETSSEINNSEISNNFSSESVTSDNITNNLIQAEENISPAIGSIKVVEGITTQASMSEPSPTNINTNSEVIALQSSIAKLEKVIELQEQLLHSQDNEIKDLKKQRKWLQERVERLEDKGERDQLLLISETQMLTKMFLEQVNKKSIFAQTLEWLGLKINNTLEAKSISYKPVVDHKDQEEKK
jgi:hypothetical protein